MIRYIGKVLTSKWFFACIIIFSQILFVILTFYSLSRQFLLWRILLVITGIIATLHIINREGDNTFKIGWITLILIQPVMGTALYFMLGNARIPKRLKNLAKREKNEKNNKIYYENDDEILNEIKKLDMGIYQSMYFLSNVAGFPVYKNTFTHYLKSGEEKFKTMIEVLKNAKKFILLEYFIIDNGQLWEEILTILKEKVKEGVEVFVMYDDIGCINTLPPYYDRQLREMGIKCRVFNPIRLTAAIQMNHRNHRKLCIVDGEVAITGGINLSDEYANLKKRFGHWRDSSVLIKGEAVWNFTLVFLRFFSYLDNTEIDYFKYKADKSVFAHYEKGYVVPYSDSPTDEVDVGHATHLNMITNAKQYIFIQSPYVVLDQVIRSALIMAAQKGVDVRIMIPHIPDKKYVFYVTQEHCRILMKYGVRIYEYLPGFVHAKTFVCDDTNALVGTVNLDYRSYYQNYECGVLFYQSKVVKQVKEDFLNALNKCREVSYTQYTNVKISEKIIRAVLNVFSPTL